MIKLAKLGYKDSFLNSKERIYIRSFEDSTFAEVTENCQE
jgi:hypothetical protein